MKKAYLLALSLLTVPVMADNTKGFYVGLGVSSVDDRQDPVDTEAVRIGELIGGYKYNDALGAEIRVGSGLRAGKGITFVFNDAHTAINPTGQLERDLGTYESIYYKPELENDEAKLYALIGYTRISSSLTKKDLMGAELDRSSISYSGASYGIGIGFVINEYLNINFEYKNICEELYDRPNTSSINLDYRF